MFDVYIQRADLQSWAKYWGLALELRLSIFALEWRCDLDYVTLGHTYLANHRILNSKPCPWHEPLIGEGSHYGRTFKFMETILYSHIIIVYYYILLLFLSWNDILADLNVRSIYHLFPATHLCVIKLYHTQSNYFNIMIIFPFIFSKHVLFSSSFIVCASWSKCDGVCIKMRYFFWKVKQEKQRDIWQKKVEDVLFWPDFWTREKKISRKHRASYYLKLNCRLKKLRFEHVDWKFMTARLFTSYLARAVHWLVFSSAHEKKTNKKNASRATRAAQCGASLFFFFSVRSARLSFSAANHTKNSFYFGLMSIFTNQNILGNFKWAVSKQSRAKSKSDVCQTRHNQSLSCHFGGR